MDESMVRIESASRREVVERLREAIRRSRNRQGAATVREREPQPSATVREREPQPSSRRISSSGCEVLDRLLPAGGLVRGTLVEWLAVGSGSGAGTLALLAARQACLEGGPLVVIDRPRRFYPPAAYRWGIDPAKIVLIQPASVRDEYWALDQVLRSAEVGAVLSWSERIDPRTFRRLQLAAESGEGLGLLVRPARFRGEPSWADIRWQVCPGASTDGWHLRVEFLRLRGEVFQRQVELKIEEPAGRVHEADRVPVVSGLASKAAGGRPAGA